jgi:predicted dehydrogenase
MIAPLPAALPASSNSSVKVGVCGLGYGLHHMGQLALSQQANLVQVQAVCDERPDRRAVGGRLLRCSEYDSLTAMLAQADIEAVALFSGPVGRAALIRQILQAGKHVMTTKPFELDAEAGLAVLHEARARGLAVFLNSPAPLLGADIIQIRRWQEHHRLGRLIFTRMDSWYRSTEKADGSWYDDPSMCPVAPIFRLGIYGINDTLALAGGELVELQVLQSRVLTGRPTPDVAQLALRFSDGAMACIRASWCCGPIRDNQVSEFVFEHGAIWRDYSLRDHRSAPDTVLKMEAVTATGEIVTDQAGVSNLGINSAYRWDLFQRAVRGETIAGLVEPEQIVAGVRVVESMVHAANHGGVWRAP